MIKGEYRVLGAAPDGDSIRFYPDAADAWEQAGLRVRTNAAGGAQLRLEGIDALETHSSAAAGRPSGRPARRRTSSSSRREAAPDGARQATGDRR